MTRPAQIVYGDRSPQQSRTSAAFDAVTAALSTWAARQKQQQDEDAAVAKLVPWVSTLDEAKQAAFMSKLVTDNPRIAQRVAEQLKPAAPNQYDLAKEQLKYQQLGYNPDTQISMERAAPPPPPPAPMGMIGQPSVGNPLGVTPETMAPVTAPPYDPNRAAPPTPPGFQPLPTDPATAALMESRRNAEIYGADFASREPIVNQVNMSRLPPPEQPKALRVLTKIETDANTTAREAGETTRTGMTTATTKRGQDLSAATAAAGQDIQRQRLDLEKQKAGAQNDALKENIAQRKAIGKQIAQNNKKIMQYNVAFGKSFNPDEKATLHSQRTALAQQNQQLRQQLDDLINAAATEPSGHANAPGRLSKEQINTQTGQRRTVYSDDGGVTWHP